MEKPILFFDGHCNLCSGWVHFVMRFDKRRLIQFATLQGKTARERLPPSIVTDLQSIAFDEKGRLTTQSDAVAHVFKWMGGVWVIVGILVRLFPTLIRDAVYRFIATRRYTWFGKREACYLPTPNEKSRFLP